MSKRAGEEAVEPLVRDVRVSGQVVGQGYSKQAENLRRRAHELPPRDPERARLSRRATEVSVEQGRQLVRRLVG